MSGAALSSGRTFIVALCLLLGALLLPNVAAAPIQADLQFTGIPRLEGDGTWTATDGLLKLEAGDSVPPYRVEIEAARAVVRTITWTESNLEVPPLYAHERNSEPTETTAVYEDALVAVESLRPGAEMLFIDQGWDLAAHFQAATLHPVRDIMASVDPREDSFSDGSPGAEDHRGLTQSHSEHRADQILLRSPSLDVVGTGDFEFSVYEVDLKATGREGSGTHASGSSSDVASGPLAGLAQQRTQTVTVVTLEGATLSLAWSGPSDLVASRPSIAVAGFFHAPSTAGEILYDRLGVQAHDEPLSTSGDVVVAPRAVPDGEVLPYDAIEDPIVYYKSGDVAINGDADQVSVASNRIVNPFQDDPSLLAAGATGVGALAAIYAAWRWGPFAFWALYSRLERGNLLENPTRAQIYEIVCANPGISARRVHDIADASWGTVVHHLGKLEAAGYVTVANNGRAKCFYENHGKWEGHQPQLALLTRDKSRRIAEAVAAVGGRDQNALVERTGLPQSTVSYHLLKLEKAGLITKERTQQATAYFSTLHLRNLLGRLGSLSSERPRTTTEAAT